MTRIREEERIASKQQIGLLLVPAIKGAVYINTYSNNYSQPVLTKLYNENLGGYLYTFTLPYGKKIMTVC